MIHLTLGALITGGLGVAEARLFLEPLRAACGRFKIDSPKRIGHFLAQCGHESAMFTTMVENLNYTRPDRIAALFKAARTPGVAATLVRNPEKLANLVYANRNGNGPPSSGDGFRYRGRGVFQLTGRANYRAAAAALGRPYEEEPELVAKPEDAALTAAWFWDSRKLNPLADKGDVVAITRAINGPLLVGLQHRTELAHEFVGALA